MLLFENKVSKEFADKVIAQSEALPTDPSWVMLPMQLESGLNPQAVNPNGGATGLIQFLPDTAIGLGITTDALFNMSAVDQLDYVFKYLRGVQKEYGRFSSYYDIYLAIFYPYAIAQDDNYVIGSERGMGYAKLVATQNPAFDTNKDGTITKGEFKKWYDGKVYALVPTALYPLFFKKKTFCSSIKESYSYQPEFYA